MCVRLISMHKGKMKVKKKIFFLSFKHLGGAFQVKLSTDKDLISFFFPRNTFSRNFHKLPRFEAASHLKFFRLLNVTWAFFA